MLRQFFAASLAAAIVFTAVSCKTRKAFVSPFEGVPALREAAATLTPRAIEDALATRTEHLDQLWVRMGMTVRQHGKRSAPSVTLIVMYREPDELMMGISRREIGTVYTARVVGEDVVFYSNRQRDAFRGTLEELRQKADFLGGIMPRDLVAAVTVQRDLQEKLVAMRQAGEAPRTLRKDGTLLVSTPISGTNPGVVIRAIRDDDMLVSEAAVLTSWDNPHAAMRIEYQEYELIENPATGNSFAYPTRFTISIPDEEIEVECNVKEYRLAPGLPPFPDPAARAKNTYPLRSLNFETGE